jgi:hypothetical protein
MPGLTGRSRVFFRLDSVKKTGRCVCPYIVKWHSVSFRVAHSPCNPSIFLDVQVFAGWRATSFDKAYEHRCRFGPANVDADPARRDEKMVDTKKAELEEFGDLVLPLERFVESNQLPRSPCRRFSQGADHNTAPRKYLRKTVVLIRVFDPHSHSHLNPVIQMITVVACGCTHLPAPCLSIEAGCFNQS